MDPALSSLFPINQIGSDGFSWWIGQIESEKAADPKNSGRYRVRIVGTHLKNCDATPTEALPWAQVMMPVTSPFTDGGTTGATVDLRQGNWVVGFYVDNDRQKPIIMGSIGHTAGATQKSNVESDPDPGSTCKSFTTYLDDTANPNLAKPMASDEKRNGDKPASATTAETTGTTKPGEAGQTASSVPNQMPAAFYGLFAEASTTNPTGNKVCVEIANPNCGSENDLKGGLTNIIGEMLKATQQSGGNLGTFYVSKINGELNSYIDHGMEYVNKAVRLVKSFVARVKGEIVKLIREGVDKLVDLILYEKVAEETAEQAAAKADESQIDKEVENAEEPATKKQSRLKPIFDTINDVLDDLGCSMADLTDRLAQWLTDLLLGYLMDAFSNAACLVDNVVNGILDQILSFLDTLISQVLGPIQEILALLASPLDIIGNAINKVLSLLGISCDGPAATCEKVKKECVDCGTGENEDWLDNLIAEIENGALDNTTYVCEEAKTTSALDSLPGTEVVFIGGTQPPGEEDPINKTVPTDIFISYTSEDIEVTEGQQAIFTITRSGAVNTASSLTMTILGGTATQGVDYDKIYSGSSVGFAPGQTTKKIVFETYKDTLTEGPETFYIKIEENVTPVGYFVTYPGGNVHKCTINDFVDGVSNSQPPNEPPTTPVLPGGSVPVKDVQVGGIIGPTQPSLPVFSVTTDKVYYSEGETIVYHITTKNVPFDGTTYSYTIDGDVTASDISIGTLTGNFQLDSNGEATVAITLATNDDVPIVTDADGNTVDSGIDPIESIIFSIDDTPAYVLNFILAEDDTDNTNSLWSVTSDLSYAKEGQTVTFTVTTKNIPDDTNFTYKLQGNITATDIVGYRLVSNVDINNVPLKIVDGKCVIPITIALDGITESSEYFNFVIDSYVDSNGNSQEVVGAQTQVILLAERDTTLLPTKPSYFVSSDKLEYEEGETIIFTITTSGIADGTKLAYTMYGSNITKDDFVNESLFGSFVVINNTAKVYVGIKDDTSIEQVEQLNFLISGTGASASVLILDASPSEPQQPGPDKTKPCFDKPVAGKPITDENGSIISIPIVDSGCPYIFPPKVIITGPGFGATAIALLDPNNKVSEIRVTRSGKGYNINKPDDFGLRCVIDSYTLIKPGTGYTSAPTVYVDGVAGRAEAIIDERGYVVSVRPTDRTSTWNEIPQVRIIGGGGSGARVIPSVVCLDNNEYENQGYAKIGTGRYVDCP